MTPAIADHYEWTPPGTNLTVPLTRSDIEAFAAIERVFPEARSEWVKDEGKWVRLDHVKWAPPGVRR